MHYPLASLAAGAIGRHLEGLPTLAQAMKDAASLPAPVEVVEAIIREDEENRLLIAVGEVRKMVVQPPNQAMQLTASKPAVYASRICRRERMLDGMHRGLAAADLVSR